MSNSTNNNSSSTKIKPQPSVTIGYDTAFLSITIAVLNLFSAFLKFNNTELSTFVFYNSGFSVPIISLFLVSMDVFISYKRFNKYPCVVGAKIFSIISIILSSFIIICIVLVYAEFFVLENNGYISIIGNIVDLLSIKATNIFNQTVFLVIYFFAAISQCIASVFKIAANKLLKNNKTI